MSEPLRQLFEPLEPPPGGLARLRARLRRGERASGTRRLAVASVALAALSVVLVPGWLARTPSVEPAWLAQARAELSAHGREPMSVPAGASHLMAARRIPTRSPRVILYRVESVEMPLDAPEHSEE